MLLVFCVTGLSRPSLAQKLLWHWSNPQPHGNDIVGLAWNGSLGVQVCELGQVYTSPNLTDWFPQNSALTNDLQAVTFFGSRIIITGANGAIAYSDDGINFSNCSANTANWLVSVAASATKVVAVGDNGAVYTSTNGANWTLQSAPPGLGDSWLTSITYGNGVFVTTGDTGYPGGISYIANSGDGIHWTNQTPTALFTETNVGDLENVAWVNSSGSRTNFPYPGFWTVGDNYGKASNSYALYSTNNGVSWSLFNFTIPSSNVLYSVATDKTTAMLSGNSEARLGSANSGQILWSEQTGVALTNAPPWTYFAGISQSNGLYELAGDDGMLVQSYLAGGSYNWNTAYDSVRDWLWQVTAVGGLYVAVGDNARIMTSGDGADWDVEEVNLTNSITGTNTVFLCVGGNTNLLLAAGSQGSLAASLNTSVPIVETNLDGSFSTNNASALGVIWYSLSAPAATTNDLGGICVFSNQFFLTSDDGLIFSLTCTNFACLNATNVNPLIGGQNWTKASTPVTSDLAGICVLTNAYVTNGLLVACGDAGSILTSSNGINWTVRTSGTTNGLLRARCLNGVLLITGENGTLLSSTNGINWSKQNCGATNWLTDCIMVSNSWYVIGNGGVVLTSTNLTTWSSAGTITAKSLEGVASQNGQLVAVGFEGTILRSQIEPVTSPIYIYNYQLVDKYNIFSVAGTVDEMFTLDSSTNLTTWVSGPEFNLFYGDGTLDFYQGLATNAPLLQFYRCTPVP